MKANELMIGDWVKFDEDICSVDEVRLDGTVVLTSMNTDLTSVDGSQVEDKEIESIPLTPKILEKNGFMYKEAEKTCATDTFHLWWLDGSIFTLDDDSWWRSVKDDKLRVKFGGFPLEYVHQLQHALRLCGIDKEIEI